MAYARKTNQGELVQLRDEVTHEVNTDAEHLATSIFGDRADQPDMARMPNEQIDALYRAAYQRQDRPFLQAEARRDPEQFLKVTQRLGVSLPPPTPPPVPGPLPTPALAPPLPAPFAPPPMQAGPVVATPAPVVPAGLPPTPPLPLAAPIAGPPALAPPVPAVG